MAAVDSLVQMSRDRKTVVAVIGRRIIVLRRLPSHSGCERRQTNLVPDRFPKSQFLEPEREPIAYGIAVGKIEAQQNSSLFADVLPEPAYQVIDASPSAAEVALGRPGEFTTVPPGLRNPGRVRHGH